MSGDRLDPSSPSSPASFTRSAASTINPLRMRSDIPVFQPLLWIMMLVRGLPDCETARRPVASIGLYPHRGPAPQMEELDHHKAAPCSMTRVGEPPQARKNPRPYRRGYVASDGDIKTTDAEPLAVIVKKTAVFPQRFDVIGIVRDPSASHLLDRPVQCAVMMIPVTQREVLSRGIGLEERGSADTGVRSLRPRCNSLYEIAEDFCFGNCRRPIAL